MSDSEEENEGKRVVWKKHEATAGKQIFFQLVHQEIKKIINLIVTL